VRVTATSVPQEDAPREAECVGLSVSASPREAVDGGVTVRGPADSQQTDPREKTFRGSRRQAIGGLGASAAAALAMVGTYGQATHCDSPPRFITRISNPRASHGFQPGVQLAPHIRIPS